MTQQLPGGWISISLPEVADLIMGQSPPSTTYNTSKNGLPFFQGKTEFGDLYPTPETYCDTPGKIAEAGDVLISVRAPVGPTNLCQIRSCIGRGLAALRPKEEIPSKYLLYYLRNIEPWLSQQGTGSTFTAISKSDLQEIEILLAPLAEQRRIVAKLEVLLSKVDASRKRLKRIPVISKRFREAVLSAACDGRLTADWRQGNSHPECAEVLLRLMQVERKTKWEAKHVGRRYPPPQAMEERDLPAIPESWVWVNFDQCTWEITVGHVGPMRERYIPEGRPFLRSQNVRPLRFDPAGRVFIPEDFHEVLAKSALYGGEILVVRSGANTGDCCVFPKGFGEANCSDLVIARPLSGLLPEYGAAYVASPQGQAHLALHETGIAQPHFNIGAMRVKPFPLPPKAEQQEIVKRTNELFAFADQVEARYLKAKTHVDRLTQSILAKAFRGELVPQDPNDEPAAALLERLKSAPTEAPPPMRRGRPRKSTPVEVPPPKRRGRPRKTVV